MSIAALPIYVYIYIYINISLERTESERHITFQPDLNSWDYGNKRVGRPKAKWVEHAIRELWKKALKDQSTIAHNTQIDRQHFVHTQPIRRYSTTLIS